MENLVAHDNDLNLKATELRLGLPGTDEAEKEMTSCAKNHKRTLPELADESAPKGGADAEHGDQEAAPTAK
jgi:auxin-responsive protein IAA